VDRRLAAELAAMAAEDQRIRGQLPDGSFAHRLTVEQRVDFTRVDVANTDRLREIVAARGWPGRALVGDRGADDAWLIAQHADRQLDSQRLFLESLRGAVEAGDAPAEHLAYLIDRVAMNEGGPQRYGTQVADVEHGEAAPWPIEDPARVDERRASLGLGPLSEYLAGWRGMS
jgi:hypothetical protein